MANTIEACVCDYFSNFVNSAKEKRDIGEYFIKISLDKKGKFKGETNVQNRDCASSPRSSYIAAIISIRNRNRVSVTRNAIHYNKNDHEQERKIEKFKGILAKEIQRHFERGNDLEIEFIFRNCF